MDVALIAVAGTLLGVIATHWFQGRATERTASLARTEQLRQERIATYSAYAGAVVDYRHSQNDRWFRAVEEPGSDEAEESRHASYRQRTAAQAISFARAQLGKPYVWGATGPSAYDCSGLTQAAWRAAGVSLPRTTYTQINAGPRVSRSQLAPGDLVFFYSGISHVGLYIGGGQMIHAPRPGAPVRIAPIDEMPFAGATRVG